MSETSNSSEETVRPSSAQRRDMGLSTLREAGIKDDPAELTSNMSLESTAFHDAERAGICGNQSSDDVSDTGDASLANVRPSSGPGDNYKVIPVSMTNYLEGIDWNMSKEYNPVFASDSERDAMQRSLDPRGLRHSTFWQHPVRYEPSVRELNVLRTVQIDHIPKSCDVKDVLDEVRWGMVESIQLIDIGNLKGPQGSMPAPFNFARIVFVKERQASQFHRYAHNKALTIGGQQVRVYLQYEPTYPRLSEVDEAIYDKNMTRILSVFGLTHSGRYHLPGFLERRGSDLISLELRPHDIQGDENDDYEIKTVMEFRSILHACRALEAMKNGGYPCAVGFMVEPDYCARIG